MEIDAIIRKKIKLKKKLIVLRDIMLVMLGFLFILLAFVYTTDITGNIGGGMENLRYGLFSCALVLAGTAIIISVYMGKNRTSIKVFQSKSRGSKK
jgi:hypothetical protein